MKGNTLEDFMQELPAASIDELNEEQRKREQSHNIFPLDVFHPKIKPFITAMVNYYDVPRAYVGLSMLSTYSTAIGTGYQVATNKNNAISLAVWACMEGISSSGKSLSIDMAYKPLYDIQDEFDREWEAKKLEVKKHEIIFEKMRTTIYRDAHIPTLVRYVLPDNPKGVSKHSDEIMEWLNGMNQLSKKEGTDEQFWLSTWNGRSYSGIRSGKDKFVLNRPFVNVVGGIQPTITYKLFAKDRDTTGFIFRLLFAVPEEVKIATPSQLFHMPDSIEDVHTKSIRSMYFGLPVEDPYDDSKLCLLHPEAIRIFNEWTSNRIRIINSMSDIRDKEIHSGILGKIKEYALRFSALLHIADLAYEHKEFRIEEIVPEATMERALRLADYFYQSAVDVYDRVNVSMTAPAEVLQIAALVRSGWSPERIAKEMYRGKRSRQSVWRDLKRYIKEYPKVFNAEARS